MNIADKIMGVIVLLAILFIVGVAYIANKGATTEPVTIEVEETIIERKEGYGQYQYEEKVIQEAIQAKLDAEAEEIREKLEVMVSKVYPNIKAWDCKMVTTCNNVDWSIAKPEDECTYEHIVLYSDTMPDPYESYGGYCNEILLEPSNQ